MTDILPQRSSNMSTEVLDCPGVSVSQKQIHPHAVFLGDVKFHLFKIIASCFHSHQILDDWTKGGDYVEIIQILQNIF